MPSATPMRAAGKAQRQRLGNELPQHVDALRAKRRGAGRSRVVRSVTDTSMMFMMPMPPTSSEIAATLASR